MNKKIRNHKKNEETKKKRIKHNKRRNKRK